MPEEVPHSDGRLEHPTVRREHTDASFNLVLGLIVGAIVFAVVMYYLVMGFFVGQEKLLADRRRSSFPLAPSPSRTLPREPHLEPLDRLEKEASSDVFLRQEQNLRILDSYGPTAEDGYIHIPIDRAMRLVAGKLPVRKEPANQQEVQRRQNGLVDHGESNSGRMFKKRNPAWFGE